MQNCTDPDKEQFSIIHFSKKMLQNAPKQLCPNLRSSEVRASSPIYNKNITMNTVKNQILQQFNEFPLEKKRIHKYQSRQEAASDYLL
jgi:hypothetical protein